ncbi:hypothetical protein LMG27952_04878 [Paraburkholderia hiiakae]|uniref:Uncharacterized protein n=1 Tax=Paraburkholderia hiiakae TaxID=1081782 RepID=A0ABM8NYI9_9BURK|nr:hypothetical protein LMG27952_04878 [Paraburkholderia hiiakae]
MLTRRSDPPMPPPMLCRQFPFLVAHPSLGSIRTFYAPCHNDGLPPPALAGKRKR